MSFPRYSAYKDSGVVCVGDVPKNWVVGPLKACIARIESGTSVNAVDTPAEGGKFGVLKTSCVYTGLFVPSENKAVIPTEYDRLACPVMANTLIVSRMNTPDLVGAAGLSKQEYKNLFLPDRLWQVYPLNVSADYMHYWTRTSAYRAQVEMACAGTSSSMQNLGQNDFRTFMFPRPSTAEQSVIVSFLDYETAKIDTLVEEQRRLIALLHEELKCLVLASRSTERTRDLRLGNVADVMSRPVTQKEGEAYRPLGMYNRGRGIFHKDSREMLDMGDSDFFWVKSGDLVISGQFAWEGAIGLAGEEEDGCVVSHRYPVLRAKDGVALTEYLFALLLTKHGDFMLNESSWGAAGRNRPLNLGLLLKERIWVPEMKIQMKIAETLHQSRRLATEIKMQLDLLYERRSALISAAVTGKIDVRGLTSSADTVTI
jgi:type I restriction enzyme S subunit